MRSFRLATDKHKYPVRILLVEFNDASTTAERSQAQEDDCDLSADEDDDSSAGDECDLSADEYDHSTAGADYDFSAEEYIPWSFVDDQVEALLPTLTGVACLSILDKRTFTRYIGAQPFLFCLDWISGPGYKGE